MPSLQQFTAVVALLPLSLARPTAISQSLAPRGFTVTQVQNNVFGGWNGPAAHRKATLKYTSYVQTDNPDTTTSQPHVLVASGGDAAANPVDATDLEYLTPVSIGGKQYLLDLDTGSSNLWIGGANTQARNKFTSSQQPIQGDSWSISYGDGSQAAGDVYSETVIVGETTATAVAVGHATQAPDRFFLPGENGQPGADGLMGLGFSAMSTFNPPQKTWFDTAVSQGLPNVFAADLRFGSQAGSYDFGQVNAAHYSGTIHYVPVIKASDPAKQYWIVQPTSGDAGVMDTGTTLILLSSNTTQSYYSSPAAKAAGARFNSDEAQWEFLCNSTLPDFSVGFEDGAAVVPGSYLNYQNLGNGYCYSAIQNRPDGIDFSIYGDRFLVTLYVVFDQTQGYPRIGFAAKAGSLAA